MPRRRSLIHCQATTTTQILKQTNTIIFSKRHHFFISLILSFLLFSFQTSAQSIIHSFTSSIDTDPSLQAFFHQLRKPPKPVTFDPQLDPRFFEKAQSKSQLNSTTLILGSFNTQMGFSDSISDNGIKISEVVNPGLNISFRSFKKPKKNKSLKIPWGFFTFFSTLAFEMIGYNLTRSWAHAIMFVVLVNHFLKIDGNQSLIMVIRKGAYLSYRRLIWFNTIRWVIMVVFTQILARLFFGDIKDVYTSYKYFVKLAFMPYSYELIWVENLENNKIYGFLYSWYLLKMLVSWVFTVFASVVMADRGKSDWEVVKEGFRLLSLKKRPAILLKSFEYIVWGFVAAMLTGFFGELFASFIKCFMEIYFMVAWIIYYFAVKKMDANSRGVRFGYRAELQGMLVEL